jgi:2-dehydropantoate 2-reductase
MKIAVIGPGAIGCLFAGLLGRAGHEVWLLDRDPGRARQLARHGVFLSGLSGERHVTVHATAEPEEAQGAELALIAVKCYDTAAAAQSARTVLGEQGVALTLQNGLGNVETLIEALGEGRVLGGSTAQGATLIAPGQVHHAGDGVTVIGEPGGTLSERLMAIAAAFTEARLQAELTTDLPSVLWGKLATNAGLNAVATLAQVRNGGIMESGHLRQVLRSAVTEACQVAERKGIRLLHPDMVAHTEEICQRTANNVNSMLQDVRRQRRTEVSAINGAVVHHGAASGVPTPTNWALTALVHGLEETYAARGPR